MSMPLTGAYPATNELVAVAWLKTVPGIDAGQVATILPRDTSAWAAAGFVQVQALPGGQPHVDVPAIRRPMFQVDCWATNTTDSQTSSTKAPWGKANCLAELIRDATETQVYGKTIVVGGAQFKTARVQAAYLAIEPSRVLSDPAGYARYTFDLQIDWVRS